ncbi:hypothetical protein BDF21DRAFT_421159 [Thamnidium elegans]|nr:hypothetical protein BDF21DRAFT_421159 [Thamnidium elegans]
MSKYFQRGFLMIWWCTRNFPKLALVVYQELIDYFYLTPAKMWKFIDAVDYFDKLNSYNSFYEIFLGLSTALNKVEATQASFKKYVKNMEEELMVSSSFFFQINVRPNHVTFASNKTLCTNTI